MAAGPSILVKFLADTSELSGVGKTVAGAFSFNQVAEFGRNVGDVIGKVIDFGEATIGAAAADADAQAKLAQSLRTTTGATDTQIASAERFISNLSQSAAIADDDLRPALATLARGFGDTEKAQSALS